MRQDFDIIFNFSSFVPKYCYCKTEIILCEKNSSVLVKTKIRKNVKILQESQIRKQNMSSLGSKLGLTAVVRIPAFPAPVSVLLSCQGDDNIQLYVTLLQHGTFSIDSVRILKWSCFNVVNFSILNEITCTLRTKAKLLYVN